MATKMYKAFVKSKETGELTIIESEYTSKKDFARDLRANGYAVKFISTPEKFDEDSENYNWELKRRKNVREAMKQHKASKEQEVETVEQTEIETEEMAESKYIAEEYRNYFITGNERIGIVALDTHGHYCDKVFKTLEDAKRAVDEDIEYAEKKYAEQEAETETTAVETSEQTEETKDENTHIWVTKEAYFYLRNQMRKQRGFKPLTKKQKERILIHITKNGMSNKIRLDHNSLGGGDGTKDGRWWGWNVVTLKSMLKKAGYSYET